MSALQGCLFIESPKCKLFTSIPGVVRHHRLFSFEDESAYELCKTKQNKQDMVDGLHAYYTVLIQAVLGECPCIFFRYPVP